MANNETMIPIPGRLHSTATGGHVAGADEVFDDRLQKNQQAINEENESAIEGKVDKVDGKGLSTEDYTTEDKEKLAAISSGAEVNVQSDWNEGSSSSDAFIRNKPESMPASDVYEWAKQSEKPEYTKGEVGLGNVDNTSDLDKPVSTAVQSALDSKANSADLATVATSGSYNDLSNKPTIPDAQIQSDWNQADTSARDYIKNKPTIPSVPTNVSAFTNDAGYLTQHQSLSEYATESWVEGKGYLTAHQDISGKADKSTAVTNVTYDTSNKKLTKTINGTITDVVTLSTIKGDLALAKGDVGLGNVDNTSDADKPVSTAMQSALNGKVDVTNGVTDVKYDATNKKIQKTVNGTDSDVVTVSTLKTDLGLTKSDVGLGNVTNDSQVKRSEMGVSGGVATLDSSGHVPSSQLPSYVDDVIEAASSSSFPATGETGKIYVALDTNLTYRWTGSAYVEISPSLALGETSSTAYAGDKGKSLKETVDKTSNNNQTLAFGSTSTIAKVNNVDITVTMPSNPNTDTSVTSASNHYTPVADASSKLSASASGATAEWSIDVVKGLELQRDSKGHVTGVSVTSGKIPANPNVDTTYSFTGGTNKFTVTPSGSSAIDVAVTPSIANNITGTGTSGCLAKFNGANTITDAIALGSDTTQFLRNDGSWAVPNYPAQIFVRGNSGVGAALVGNVTAATASGYASVSIGADTTANGDYSFAEGVNTTASSTGSHAEGNGTTASNSYAHAEGNYTVAAGLASHTEGEHTETHNKYEHASGAYNTSNTATDNTSFGYADGTLFSVGNGSNSLGRHNAFEIRQNGDVYVPATNLIGTGSYTYANIPLIKLQDIITQDHSSGGSIITASKIVKSGGTSSQFLKADGSVDSSIYLTSSDIDHTNLAGSTLKYGYLDSQNSSSSNTLKIGLGGTTSGGANTQTNSISMGLSTWDGSEMTNTEYISISNGYLNLRGNVTVDGNTNSDSFGINSSTFISQYLRVGGLGFSDGEIHVVGHSSGDIYLQSGVSSPDSAYADRRVLRVDAHGTGSAKDIILVDTNNNVTIEGNTIKKTGGTSSQFLKADGSVDSNTYVTDVFYDSSTGELKKTAGGLNTKVCDIVQSGFVPAFNSTTGLVTMTSVGSATIAANSTTGLIAMNF